MKKHKRIQNRLMLVSSVSISHAHSSYASPSLFLVEELIAYWASSLCSKHMLLCFQPFPCDEGGRQVTDSREEYRHAEERRVRAGVQPPVVGLLNAHLSSWISVEGFSHFDSTVCLFVCREPSADLSGKQQVSLFSVPVTVWSSFCRHCCYFGLVVI